MHLIQFDLENLKICFHPYLLKLYDALLIIHFFAKRQEILESRNRRKFSLQKLLLDNKDQLHDHEIGRKLLLSEDLERLKNQINLYERKLETMSGEMGEREVEKVLQREALIYERQEERRRREYRKKRSEF